MTSTIIDGKYRVDALLGEGGMGCVYAATHLKLGSTVAIKVLKHGVSGSEEVAQRFLREARAASRLRSEHVCRVIDVDQLSTGEPYMVMELLHGTDLHRFVQTRGPLPTHVAADYLLQACEALGEAHALGMVHRDIKPANLFLADTPGKRGIIKVLDFGIATTAKGEIDGALTRTATIMGSPNYMSPEQLRSAKDVDARSDIWSIGVTLFELLSGKQPFTGDSFSALAISIATEEHHPLPAAGAELSEIINRCLAKRPGERFQSIAELVLALERASRPTGMERVREPSVSAEIAPTLPPTLPPAAPTAAETTHRSAASESLARKPQGRGRRGLAIAIGSGALVVIAGLAFMWTRPGKPDEQPNAVPVADARVAVKAPDASPHPVPPPASRASVVHAIEADYKSSSAEIDKIRAQLERARAIGDDKLAGEIKSQILDLETRRDAKVVESTQKFRDEFIRAGSVSSLQDLSEALALIGDVRASEVAALVDRLQHGQAVPSLPVDAAVATDGELQLAAIVAKDARYASVATAFTAVAQSQAAMARRASLDGVSQATRDRRDQIVHDLESARAAAAAALPDAKKAYALDGKPDELLLLAILFRLANDVQHARLLCDQYARLGASSGLLEHGVDADGDGVLVCVDDCPAEPASTPSGCSIADRDHDGVVDGTDKCPDDPETKNGYHDDDGCPDVVEYCVTGASPACFATAGACAAQIQQIAAAQHLDDHNLLALGIHCDPAAHDLPARIPARTAPSGSPPAAGSGAPRPGAIHITEQCANNPLAAGCQ